MKNRLIINGIDYDAEIFKASMEIGVFIEQRSTEIKENLDIRVFTDWAKPKNLNFWSEVTDLVKKALDLWCKFKGI